MDGIMKQSSFSSWEVQQHSVQNGMKGQLSKHNPPKKEYIHVQSHNPVLSQHVSHSNCLLKAQQLVVLYCMTLPVPLKLTRFLFLVLASAQVCWTTYRSHFINDLWSSGLKSPNVFKIEQSQRKLFLSVSSFKSWLMQTMQLFTVVPNNK